MKKYLLLIALLILSFSISYAQNYDEAKVPSYKLPDPLITTTGKVIRSTSDWEKIRRPELLRLFEENVYGVMPKDFDSIRFVIEQFSSTMQAKAKLKRVMVRVWRDAHEVRIRMTMFVPAKLNGKVPVFLLINNRGKEITDPTRQQPSEFWPAEALIDSGFAIAAFHVSDAAPDNAERYKEGVLQLYFDQLKNSNSMKAIGAWAWAASRLMDYFQTDPDIDSKKVYVVGHSRGGKAALWAGAQDERFAMVFSNCSGNTGAAISRRRVGETIKRINTSFPFWFNDNYKKFNDNEDQLPVDQHLLLALIAPRPLYTTNATKDLWADPIGSYLSVKEATKIYRLYDSKLKLPVNPPATNTALLSAVTGYHIREGEHNLTLYDWNYFIQFAKRH